MEGFQLFARPWWVNLLILVPLVAYYALRKKKPNVSREQLLLCFLFGAAFGLVEASVVVYLRAALGAFSPSFQLPGGFFLMEVLREAATVAMLLSVTFLAAKTARERWAVFLLIFAAWDIFYYVFLWLIIRWPPSFTTTDVLFLIPVPWYAQVWFPILVDALTVLAVIGATFPP